MFRRVMPRILKAALVLFLVAGSVLVPSSSASASARTASWSVSVTYQNVGIGDASITMALYSEGNGSAITTINPMGGTNTLPAGAGTSLYIGSVSGLASGFRGSAVMESDQPLIATVVQFSQDAGFKMRLLSNGFSSSDGSNQYLIASTLRNRFGRTTVFSVQNPETQTIRATVTLYNADNPAAGPVATQHVIPAGSSKYIELDDAADTGVIPNPFNGSAIITAVIEGTSTPAKVVAAASEMYTTSNVAANFEGIPLSRASNNVYMATALCRNSNLITYYAVQNTSMVDSASVTVSYMDANGNLYRTDGPYALGPGGKKSIDTCSPQPAGGPTMEGFSGAARITSVGAPIVAIGKAQGTGLSPATKDFFTAFMGERDGYSKLALPFIRWANDANYNSASNVGGKQRAYLAIQNLGTSSAIADVEYYNKSGVKVATETVMIAALAKGRSNPSTAGALGLSGMNPGEFGYYTDGSFGGAVIVKANAANPTAKFIAIARVQHPGAGEDYNAVSAP